MIRTFLDSGVLLAAARDTDAHSTEGIRNLGRQ